MQVLTASELASGAVGANQARKENEKHMSKLPTTGKVTSKRYRCVHCMARKAFVRKIPDALERMEFEVRVLSTDSECLPEIAVAVRDHGVEPTAEYWRFLASQAEQR